MPVTVQARDTHIVVVANVSKKLGKVVFAWCEEPLGSYSVRSV